MAVTKAHQGIFQGAMGALFGTLIVNTTGGVWSGSMMMSRKRFKGCLIALSID
jgi:hypothetical protein